MCVGIPMQVIDCEGIAARCSDGTAEATIDLSLTGPQSPGTWVLTFLGAAREVLDPEEAAKITAALAGLQRLMDGQDLGPAFADLEQGGPRLPPHLQAALDSGRPTG